MKPEERILKDLNETQREAVTYGNGPLLVLAGAGSGKTRILTHRIAHLLANRIPPYSILGVTFTNKAAAEMRERVEKLVGRKVWISTFHSTCLKILRSDIDALGISPEFTVYDDSDQLVLIKECLKEMGIDHKQVHPKAVREFISRAKDYLKTPSKIAGDAYDFYEEQLAKIYDLYEKKLRGYGGLDFGDLIMKTVQLFEAKPDVLETWQERFKYILVDEYQDTNHAQYTFIKLAAERYRNITVVGDPDQSIYAWRGADIGNILSFEEDYPDARIIKMEQNYRSTQKILDAANALISCNASRKEKDLWTDAESGETLTLSEVMDEKAEAKYVVSSVKEYLDGGKNPRDIVVFYRVHAQSRVLEDELRRSNIPYNIIGGVKFYDRREIKDLIAYLKVIAMPQDELSLKRILNVPVRGIGKKTMTLLEEFRARERIDLYTALARVKEIEGISKKAKKSILSFFNLIEDLRLKKLRVPLRDILETVIYETAYVRTLEKEGTIEARSRIENIKEFFGVIYEFEENTEEPQENHLRMFLESISLETDLDNWDNSEDMLTLMTLHMAKGLEFDIVFMVGLEEGIFPHVNSFGGDIQELEEERRLCYVGITRARKKVHLSYASSRRLYGFTQNNFPSRFLDEIPPNLTNRDVNLVPDIGYDEPDDEEYVELDQEEIRRRVLYD